MFFKTVNWWVKDLIAELLLHMDSVHKNLQIIFSGGSLDRCKELVVLLIHL